jgi:hypothetical protein
MSEPLHVSFVAGEAGPWRIESVAAVAGDPLPMAPRLAVHERPGVIDGAAVWALRGTTSNTRYTRREEADRLAAVQQGLGRPQARCAALIPIRKSGAWWALAQDERRAVFEEQSRHIAIGLRALPGVARRLHHCRDLGGEPFDFLTWFDFAPGDAPAFEAMVAELRRSPEWTYVEREVDVRLVLD